ncbi:MAG: HIT family protein [Actinomycetota bacterium]
MAYVSSADNDDGCVFCEGLAGSDDAARILHKGERVFVILNAFPYNTGHLMIAPNRHVGDLAALDYDERCELMEVTTKSIDVVRAAMNAHGFNIGVNLGRVAGAGIPGHVHVHVVPRWGGDTNFMPVTGDAKVLPELIEDTAAKLRPGFANL